jgi:hypothetical protein
MKIHIPVESCVRPPDRKPSSSGPPAPFHLIRAFSLRINVINRPADHILDQNRLGDLALAGIKRTDRLTVRRTVTVSAIAMTSFSLCEIMIDVMPSAFTLSED